MAKVQINRYGLPLIKSVRQEHAPTFYNMFYIVDTATPNIEYCCFRADPKRVIWRKTTQGDTETWEFSYGAWEDRANLTYVPIYGVLEVDG